MRGLIVLSLLVVAALGGRADAYPQFQLSRDQMCTSCHLSPSGGGLLSENGLNTAEVISQYGTDPTFLNGVVTPPSWLALGGDFRAMGGYNRAPQQFLEIFPMQGDVYARATFGQFAAQATVGFRPAQEGNEAATHVLPRELYAQWQSEEGGSEGIWVRAGRFMPVFGLRFVEHPLYTRRYGGTPLLSETYGASVSYVTEKYEGHATGFVKDPLIDPVRMTNGGAGYGEVREGNASIGAGAMYEKGDLASTVRTALTGKYYLSSPGILLQTEIQLFWTMVSDVRVAQLVGNLMGSYFVTDSVMVDLALGRYDENLRITNVDRNAVDLNVHWFVTSHFEALFVSRYEQIGLSGDGGPHGGWAMLQAHYRL